MDAISVIIPALNSGDTLGETLDSVIAQTRQPDETVVVVDDSSTDDTLRVAESYAGRLTGLNVLLIPHVGLSYARNRGVAASSMPLIATLDADDLWHPDYLARMVGRLTERPEAGYVYSFLRIIDMEDRIIARPRVHAADGWAFYQLLADNFILNGSNTVFRREHVQRIGYCEDLNGSEDYLMQLELAARAPVTCVPQHLVGYRQRPGAMSRRGPKVTVAESLKMLGILRERVPGIEDAPYHQAEAVRHLRMYSGVKREKAARGVAREHLGRAFALDPLRTVTDLLRQSRVARRPPPRSDHEGMDFSAVSPEVTEALPVDRLTGRRLRRAAELDRRLGGPIVPP